MVLRVSINPIRPRHPARLKVKEKRGELGKLGLDILDF